MQRDSDLFGSNLILSLFGSKIVILHMKFELYHLFNLKTTNELSIYKKSDT